MKVRDILDKKMTVLNTVSGYTYHTDTTNEYTQVDMSLEHIIRLGDNYKIPIDKLRSMEYHSDEQKDYKQRFPCWFVGGIFPMFKTEDKDILTYSNLMAIDIDKKDNVNTDLESLKVELFSLPYVILVSKSISGKGIYALILVEDGQYTKDYYNYIYNLWTRKYNIKIDNKCSNIGRKRFISYDDDILIKDLDIDIKEWKLKPIPVKQDIERQRIIDYKPQSLDTNIELTRKAIWYLLNNGYSIDNIHTDNAYTVWYYIACEFRHFPDGEDMFIKFSNNTLKYTDNIKKILSKWEQSSTKTQINDVCRKWCGICKNIYGKNWYKLI